MDEVKVICKIMGRDSYLAKCMVNMNTCPNLDNFHLGSSQWDTLHFHSLCCLGRHKPNHVKGRVGRIENGNRAASAHLLMVRPLASGYILQFHIMTTRRYAAPTQASRPPGPGFIPPNGGPVFPEPQVARTTTTTRRAQTPFMRPSMDQDDDDDVRRTQGRATPHPQPGLGIHIQESTTGRSRHGHHTQTPGQPPPRQLYDRYRRDSEESLRDANIARVLEPLEPADPGVFGPSHGRARAPLSNPLPPPPRDIY